MAFIFLNGLAFKIDVLIFDEVLVLPIKGDLRSSDLTHTWYDEIGHYNAY